MAAIIRFTPNYAFSNGVFQGGAKVSFFLTGTTTPVTVYTDEARTTPHPTPVVADASGTFPMIWGEDGVNLKAVVTASDDSAIDTYDPVILGNIATQTAAGIALDPITGNSGTDVQGGIEANTARLETLDLDDVTTTGRSLIEAANAAAGRTVLGLDILAGGTAAQATTSGTTVDFTGIPATASEVTLHLDGTAASGDVDLYMGDSGGFATTSFDGLFKQSADNVSDQFLSFSAANAFAVASQGTVVGSVTLRRVAAGSNVWTCQLAVAETVIDALFSAAFRSTMTGNLTSLRIGTQTGAFTAGSASVTWR